MSKSSSSLTQFYNNSLLTDPPVSAFAHIYSLSSTQCKNDSYNEKSENGISLSQTLSGSCFLVQGISHSTLVTSTVLHGLPLLLPLVLFPSTFLFPSAPVMLSQNLQHSLPQYLVLVVPSTWKPLCSRYLHGSTPHLCLCLRLSLPTLYKALTISLCCFIFLTFITICHSV